MKKRQVLKFNADELCKTHLKKQHARTFKSKKVTGTKLQTKCNSFFCRKRQCETNTDCLADNYKTFDGCYCTKKTLWAKPSACETCIAQSFSCVNRSFSKLLLLKTAGKRQKFLQFLQQTPCEKIAHLRNLHCAEFCLCKHDICKHHMFKTSTAKNSG